MRPVPQQTSSTRETPASSGCQTPTMKSAQNG